MNHYFLGICIIIGCLIIAINEPNIKFPSGCTIQPMKMVFIHGSKTLGISSLNIIPPDNNEVAPNLTENSYNVRCY